MGRSRERQGGDLLTRAVRGLVRVLSRRGASAPHRSDDPKDYSRHGGLSEEEAARIALVVTHEVREEMGRGLEPAEERLPVPSPEEVRKRREERRKREDESYY